jgi:hypothetical protein
MGVEINIYIIIHILALIIGILLIYYSILILKRLKSKDFAVSMIFLHEKNITNIFLVLVIGSFIFLLGQIYNTSTGGGELYYIIANIIGLVYSFVLLYFVYELQKILRTGEDYDQLY